MDAVIFFSPFLFVILGLLGAACGFLAGLLGVGGGLVLVPGLLFVFHFLGYEAASITHVCVGTSLCSIVFTGGASARAHWKRRSVDVILVVRIGAGIILGAALGSMLAAFIDGVALMMVFASALIVLAGLMVSDLSKLRLPQVMFSHTGNIVAGIITGTFSTLVGIGGGTLNVPYMHAGGKDLRHAIGTASALGILIAIPASIGFMIIGWDVSGRPPFSLGYVNVGVLAVILPVSVMFAPLGARLAHSIDTGRLRMGFAAFIVVVSVKLWFEVLS